VNESFRLRFKKGARVWRVAQVSVEDYYKVVSA
jgi:hypothetical protein